MKLSNVKVLSITKLKDNTLASLSDENIYITTSQIQVDGNLEALNLRQFYIMWLKFYLLDMDYIKKIEILKNKDS